MCAKSVMLGEEMSIIIFDSMLCNHYFRLMLSGQDDLQHFKHLMRFACSYWLEFATCYCFSIFYLLNSSIHTQMHWIDFIFDTWRYWFWNNLIYFIGNNFQFWINPYKQHMSRIMFLNSIKCSDLYFWSGIGKFVTKIMKRSWVKDCRPEFECVYVHTLEGKRRGKYEAGGFTFNKRTWLWVRVKSIGTWRSRQGKSLNVRATLVCCC